MNNKELSQFESDLLESIRQAQSGDHATVHTPEIIAARKRGRPIVGEEKKAISLRLPISVLERWKATGAGWQTRMAEDLAKHAP